MRGGEGGDEVRVEVYAVGYAWETGGGLVSGVGFLLAFVGGLEGKWVAHL